MSNKKQVIIDGFPHIKCEVFKDSVFATINLASLTYTKDGVSVLLNSIAKLKEMGFTTFDTSYNTGFYDSVEDISIEFHAKANEIDIKQLRPIS